MKIHSRVEQRLSAIIARFTFNDISLCCEAFLLVYKNSNQAFKCQSTPLWLIVTDWDYNKNIDHIHRAY